MSQFNEDRSLTPIKCKADHMIIILPDNENKIYSRNELELSNGQIKQLANHLLSCSSLKDSAIENNYSLSDIEKLEFISSKILESEWYFDHFFPI